MTTIARLSIATFATVAVLVSPAAADTINNTNGYVSFSDEGVEASTLTFTSNPGSVAVTQSGGDTITGSGTGCEAGPSTTITCTDPDIYTLQVVAGDGDDQVSVTGTAASGVSGGGGADTLTGSDENAAFEALYGQEGDDIIDTRNVTSQQLPFAVGDGAYGGDGSDTITTGNGWDFVDGDECCGPDPNSGADVISTGLGNDRVRPGGGVDQVALGEGNDTFLAFGIDGFGETLDGGPGTDTVQVTTYYEVPEQPADNFTVDLGAGTIAKTNEPSGSSSTPGFEKAITGLGADTVAGTDGPNTIETTNGIELFGGLDGADALGDSGVMGGDGNGGATTPDLSDVVNPKAGADDVATGAGDDQIDSRDGFPDSINCGPGTDTVQADQFDSVVQCENAPITNTRAAGADLVPPSCKLSKVKGSYSLSAFSKGFTATVDCNEGGTVLFRLIAGLKGAKGGKLIAKAGDLVLAEKSVTTASGDANAKLRPAKRLLRRLRTTKGFKVRVEVDARDEFGNRSLLKKQVRVKKRKAAKRKRRQRG